MRLAGRHALVTGGGTGIGAAVALALAAEGARLTLIGRRLEKLEAVALQLRSLRARSTSGENGVGGGPVPAPFEFAQDERMGVICVSADVTDRASVDRAFEAARGANGPLSILVNNAGAAQGAAFGTVSERAWRDALAVNLDGMFHCCQAALADLRADPAGRIVTVASMAGLYGFSYVAPYVAAKHGAIGLTRALAAEYARTSLTANAVCPGFVDTEMTAESVANIRARTGRSEEEARAELARLNPCGRLIAPAEVAAGVLDLILSDRNGEALEIA